MLNRSAVTIKAKQPFIDWILSLPESEHVTRNDIDEDSTVYLLPDSFDGTTTEKLLQQFSGGAGGKSEDTKIGLWQNQRF